MTLGELEFQVDDKDRAITSGVIAFEVMESPERKITPQHLVGGALRSNIAELPLGGAKQKRSSLEAIQSRSFFASENWRIRKGQFRDLTTCNPSLSYKSGCAVIRVSMLW